MTVRLAKIISVIFHPLLMPSYIFLGILYFLPHLLNFNTDLAWRFMLMVFMTTFLIPFMGILLLNFTKTISDLNMFNRKERFFPFLFISFFYAATTYLFWEKFRFPPLINHVMISITLSAIVLTIISLFWKMSAHAMAIAGAAGLYFGFLMNTGNSQISTGLAICFLLSGFVASARLKLMAHDSQQIWVGLAAGFVLNCIMILILN